jgi:hypothetical protein
MLNLLIERDTFPEQMARFYVAEMILAIEEVRAYMFICASLSEMLERPDGLHSPGYQTR